MCVLRCALPLSLSPSASLPPFHSVSVSLCILPKTDVCLVDGPKGS